MTVQTLTLTDFLLARIADDELAAQVPRGVVLVSGGSYYSAPAGHLEAHTCDEYSDSYLVADPARVLAECEAKRAIVTEHDDGTTYSDGSHLGYCPRCVEHGGEDPEAMRAYPCPTLRALASVYADHPAYRGEWRP